MVKVTAGNACVIVCDAHNPQLQATHGMAEHCTAETIPLLW